MTHFDEILELSLDHYGLFTYAQAAEIGVSGTELARFVEAGRLLKIGRGLYQVSMRLETPFDRYAQAVAAVGKGGLLYGTSVLAMLGLANVNPREINVFVNRRLRKSLPDWVCVVSAKDVGGATKYHGIPSQTVHYAILASSGAVMDERLVNAAEEAHGRGLMGADALQMVKRELAYA